MLTEKAGGPVLSGAERFRTERKTCETSPGRRSGKTAGVEKSNIKWDGSVREREREYSGCPTAQSCALSRAGHAWGGSWSVMDGYQGANCS